VGGGGVRRACPCPHHAPPADRWPIAPDCDCDCDCACDCDDDARYIEAFGITAGVALFMMVEKAGPAGGGPSDSAVGIMILCVYIFCDSFTSQWQASERLAPSERRETPSDERRRATRDAERAETPSRHESHETRREWQASERLTPSDSRRASERR
jgi:hypothetical protein